MQFNKLYYLDGLGLYTNIKNQTIFIDYVIYELYSIYNTQYNNKCNTYSLLILVNCVHYYSIVLNDITITSSTWNLNFLKIICIYDDIYNNNIL